MSKGIVKNLKWRSFLHCLALSWRRTRTSQGPYVKCQGVTSCSGSLGHSNKLDNGLFMMWVYSDASIAQNLISQLHVWFNPNLYQNKLVQILAHDINSRDYKNVSLLFLEDSIFSFKTMKNPWLKAESKTFISSCSNVIYNASVYLTKPRGIILGQLDVKNCSFKFLDFFLNCIFLRHNCDFPTIWSANSSYFVHLNGSAFPVCTAAQITSGTSCSTKWELWLESSSEEVCCFVKTGVFGS